MEILTLRFPHKSFIAIDSDAAPTTLWTVGDLIREAAAEIANATDEHRRIAIMVCNERKYRVNGGFVVYVAKQLLEMQGSGAVGYVPTERVTTKTLEELIMEGRSRVMLQKHDCPGLFKSTHHICQTWQLLHHNRTLIDTPLYMSRAESAADYAAAFATIAEVMNYRFFYNGTGSCLVKPNLSRVTVGNIKLDVKWGGMLYEQACIEFLKCLSSNSAYFHIFSAEAGFMTNHLAIAAMGPTPSVFPPAVVHGYGKDAKPMLARLDQLRVW